MFSLDIGNLLYFDKITEKQTERITGNYGGTAGGSDIRKLFWVLVQVYGNKITVNYSSYFYETDVMLSKIPLTKTFKRVYYTTVKY